MRTEMENILEFIAKTKGLKAEIKDSGAISVTQDTDGKVFCFDAKDVIEVLQRSDSDNKPFIQINFRNSIKVLLTESLIGFKPVDTFGLDMSRIPKVVTTPDLQSVYEAIEDSLGSDNHDHEVEILKKVFLAILNGGEKVGFNLQFERQWLNRLMASRTRASA